jgi:hypothetical protein
MKTFMAKYLSSHPEAGLFFFFRTILNYHGAATYLLIIRPYIRKTPLQNQT